MSQRRRGRRDKFCLGPTGGDGCSHRRLLGSGSGQDRICPYIGIGIDFLKLLSRNTVQIGHNSGGSCGPYVLEDPVCVSALFADTRVGIGQRLAKALIQNIHTVGGLDCCLAWLSGCVEFEESLHVRDDIRSDLHVFLL